MGVPVDQKWGSVELDFRYPTLKVMTSTGRVLKIESENWGAQRYRLNLPLYLN